MPIQFPTPVPSVQPLAINTNRRIYIQNLVNLLYASLGKGDVERAERSWALLCRCKELDWRTTWKLALAVFDCRLNAGHDSDDALASSSRGMVNSQSMIHGVASGESSATTDDVDMEDEDEPFRISPPHESLSSSSTTFPSQPRSSYTNGSPDQPSRHNLKRFPSETYASKILFLRRLLVSVPPGKRPEVLLNLVLAFIRGSEPRRSDLALLTDGDERVKGGRSKRGGKAAARGRTGDAGVIRSQAEEREVRMRESRERRERVEGCRKALDELELYLPSHPYILSPSLHIYAGLISFYLAQPEPSEAPADSGIESDMTQGHVRQPHGWDPDSDSEHGKSPAEEMDLMFELSGRIASVGGRKRARLHQNGRKGRQDRALSSGQGDSSGSDGSGSEDEDDDRARGWDKTQLKSSLAYFVKSKELVSSAAEIGGESGGPGPSMAGSGGGDDEISNTWIRRIRKMLGERSDRVVVETQEGPSHLESFAERDTTPYPDEILASQESEVTGSEEDGSDAEKDENDDAVYGAGTGGGVVQVSCGDPRNGTMRYAGHARSSDPEPITQRLLSPRYADLDADADETGKEEGEDSEDAKSDYSDALSIG